MFNVEQLRKKKIITFLQKQDFIEDNVTFLINYLRQNFGEGVYAKTKGGMPEAEFKELLKSTQYFKLQKGEKLKQTDQGYRYDQLPICFVIEGQLKLISTDLKSDERENPTFIRFNTKDMILITDEFILEKSLDFSRMQVNLHLEAACETEVIMLDRALYSQISDKYQESDEAKSKVELLSRFFSKLHSADLNLKFQLAKYFKEVTYNKGDVIQTPTSGSTNLIFIKKGKILLFVPFKNPERSGEFVILSVIGDHSIYNESQVFLDQPALYGSLILEDTQVYTVEKSHIKFITEESSIELMKADYLSKERLYRLIQNRLFAEQPEAFLTHHLDACKKQGLDYENIKQLIKKSTVNKKIVTVSYIKENQTNLEKFDKLVGKNKLGTITDKDARGIFTPMLQLRNPKVDSMNAEQQLSFLALRSDATKRRAGEKGTSEKLSDVKLEDLVQQKEVVETSDQQVIQKKDIVSQKQDVNQRLKNMDEQKVLQRFNIGVQPPKPDEQKKKAEEPRRIMQMNMIGGKPPGDKPKQVDVFAMKRNIIKNLE